MQRILVDGRGPVIARRPDRKIEPAGGPVQIPVDVDRAFTPAGDPDPRFEKPDYVAGLLLLGGVALAVHPAGDRVAGAILAVGGSYLLWRRH